MDIISTLPETYLEQMKVLLGDEYEAFLASYKENALKALRFNPKKARPDTIEKLKNEWKLEPVKWCNDGYYYSGELRPGLSPYHDAGVYYIQEPSAMLTAEMADIKTDDIVLDLCAAPGGKSSQAAATCKIIISNEPIANRARILSSNIERMGFDNCIVTSSYPDELSAVFNEFFDCIIVDAPCSGEGMMRKDETAVKEWSLDNVSLCIDRQRDILEKAYLMLKQGGRIAYSTCTFEKGENEDQIKHFIERHDDLELIKEHRLMPHKDKGEGHFCAVIRKSGEPAARKKEPDLKSITSLLKKKKIHVLRSGIEAGEQKSDKGGKSYYIPSHAEALARHFDTDDQPKININSINICERYLHGDAININELEEGDIDFEYARDGFVTVYYDGYPLGNAKLVKGILKNHYPKGLRRV